MTEVKSCGVLVVRGEPLSEFLLMKHPTRFDLPKGHVDPGETEIECALRELWEETGIAHDAIELDPHFRFTHQYITFDKHLGRNAEKTLVVFLGRLLRDVLILPTEHEHFEWRPWLPPHQIQEKTIDPLLAAVARFLANGKA